MVSPFDGAGTPYKGPSWRGPIITFLMIVIAVALLWLAASWAMSKVSLDPPPAPAAIVDATA